MASRSRSSRANDAWESLLTAHASLMKRFMADPNWGEITMREYDVIYTLSKHDAPLRLFELGRGVLLSQPALSRLVDRLVERGLIERSPDPEDGRGVRLGLTSEGRDWQRRVGGRHAVDVARAVTAALSDEEMAQLESIGRKLAAQGAMAPMQRNRQEATQ